MKASQRTAAGPVTWVARVLLFLGYGVPILWIILPSLKNPGDVLSTRTSFFFQPTLTAYTDALTNAGLITAGIQSITIASGTTLLPCSSPSRGLRTGAGGRANHHNCAGITDRAANHAADRHRDPAVSDFRQLGSAGPTTR